MISCTLWSTHQSSNTSYFGHFIRALPSYIYSNIILRFTVALSRKYQHCCSLNSMLNLTQVNCYCWQSAGCVVKASWQHDNSCLRELVWCRIIQAKDWRYRDPDSAFSTQVIPAEHCPNVPGEACATLPVQDSWVNSIHHRPQAYASPQDVFKLLLTAKYSLLHLFLSDDLTYMFIFKSYLTFC